MRRLQMDDFAEDSASGKKKHVGVQLQEGKPLADRDWNEKKDNNWWVILGVFLAVLAFMPVIASYLNFRVASDMYAILLHTSKYWGHLVLNTFTFGIGTAGSVLIGIGVVTRNKKILIIALIVSLVYVVMWILGYNRYFL